jgi:predicted RNA binding protein YcfA (HicA-like mRNA interferase family)
MKVIKVSEIIRRLKENGWYLDRQKGSHRQYWHDEKKRLVTVNGKPSDDITGDLLKSIENQSGIEF